MPQKYIIEEATATGEQIGELVARINNVLAGENRAHSIMAAVAFALALQNPEITGEELPDLIMDVSRYLCLVLAGNDGGDLQ